MPLGRKRNLRYVPESVTEKIAALGDQPFYVGCVRKVPLADVAAGMFNHLGLAVNAGELQFNPTVRPPAAQGKCSKRNVEGRTVVRKDLPKVIKSIDLGERPVYGDWGNGSFDLVVDRLVYQREAEPARNLDINIRVLATENVAERKFIIAFRVDALLYSGEEDFATKLIFSLNLLQESVGAVDVIPADATDDQLLGILYVPWEVLPPGERDATLAEIFRIAGAVDQESRERLQERYDLLANFNPLQWIVGTGGFEGYFGALFEDRVFFDNLQYGNALYCFEVDKWEMLCKLSRTDLMRNHRGEFRRIVHRAGWMEKLRQELHH